MILKRDAIRPHDFAVHATFPVHLENSCYALGVAELGMEVNPPAPYTPGAWLYRVAARLGMPRAEQRTRTAGRRRRAVKDR
ncbi:hypothetical protein ACH4F6_29195 [Streptomyces sp. NPDC017936]|uniref:hypothetical protein n=1 Tax=Streptomyces sp. NPDC017936 TaxID=3365016 RepID=UPI0037AE8162